VSSDDIQMNKSILRAITNHGLIHQSLVQESQCLTQLSLQRRALFPAMNLDCPAMSLTLQPYQGNFGRRAKAIIARQTASASIPTTTLAAAPGVSLFSRMPLGCSESFIRACQFAQHQYSSGHFFRIITCRNLLASRRAWIRILPQLCPTTTSSKFALSMAKSWTSKSDELSDKSKSLAEPK
jgi:hypothetical protein